MADKPKTNVDKFFELYDADPALQARVCAVVPGTPAIVGTPCGDGKFGPPEQSWAELCTLADYVLVEADGSRGLPLKAHLSHEPVLPQEAGSSPCSG